MSSAPVHFTILVPTRNRADTLAYCLKSIMAQDYPHLSVIVSDNKSVDHTKEIVEGISDPRVKYVSPPQSLSMRDNWEFALSHAQGGWLSVLGDDDGLAPGALELVARVIEKYKVEAVTSSWCRYTWPGEGLSHANKLILPFGAGVQIRDAKAWQQRVLSGAWRYIELPYLYTGGFVHRDVIDRFTASGIRFFNSVIPDVYSALAISCFVDKYAFICNPIALRGTSPHSTGASSFQSSTNEKPKNDFIEENRAFIHALLKHDTLPMSTHLFVYEAYLQVSRIIGNTAEAEAIADMRRHLAIASTLARKRERAAIRDYEVSILSRAGSIKPLSLKEKLWACWLVKWAYFLVEVKRVLGSALIDMSRLGIRDVYAAGIAARAMHWQAGHNNFRRARRIFGSLLLYVGPMLRSRS